MYYNEKQEYSHLLEENQIIYKVEESPDQIKVYIKDTAKEAVCPVCGHLR